MSNSEESKNICFQCLGEACPSNCCGAFNGVSNKLKSMHGINPSKIILLPRDIELLKEISREDLIISKDNFNFLQTYKDGRCHALAKGKCSIYQQRPSICRAYPFYFDMFMGLCVDTNCPGIREIHGDCTVEDEYYNYLVSVYQYWMKRQ